MIWRKPLRSCGAEALKRAVEVVHEIPLIFQADRQAKQAVADSGDAPRLGSHAQVGHGGGVGAAVMPKGSLCFVLGTCYHGGGANLSDQRRWALTINYCAGAMRQQENLMLAVPRERAADFSEDLQALICYGQTLRNVGHVNAAHPRRLLEPYKTGG
jgi:hypothetical protein